MLFGRAIRQENYLCVARRYFGEEKEICVRTCAGVERQRSTGTGDLQNGGLSRTEHLGSRRDFICPVTAYQELKTLDSIANRNTLPFRPVSLRTSLRVPSSDTTPPSN